jgi:hypothetical protein
MRTIIPTMRIMMILAIGMIISAGCGGHDPSNPAAPGISAPGAQNSTDSIDKTQTQRTLWGIWDVGINKLDGSVEIVPLRDSNFHINALNFLEPPVLKGLSIDNTTLVIDQKENLVKVDVKLVHPFPGLNKYMGFDVRGIVLMPGSEIPSSDLSLVFSGPTEPRLLNPDGYTRWWNPTEFPGSGIFGFQPGLLGKKGGAGVFTATINGYKYFADGLKVDDSISKLPVAGRGYFSAGGTNRRHYEISFGDKSSDWLRFQYAVDACWMEAKTDPSGPNDFPVTANAPEGFGISVNEVENTIWWLEGLGMGGKLKVNVDVYSWRPSKIQKVTLEAPEISSHLINATLVPGSGGGADSPPYSTWYAEMTPDVLNSAGPFDMLVTASTGESYNQGGLTVFFGPSDAKISLYARTGVNLSEPLLKWEQVVMAALPQQPMTVTSDISVVGYGPNSGVYFFGKDWQIWRYPIHYTGPAVMATTLLDYLGYNQKDLYGDYTTMGRFDLAQTRQFVCSSIAATPSPTFLGGWKRDYAFFFDNSLVSDGQLPVQIGLPDPSMGYFRMVDVSANSASEDADAKIYWVQVEDPPAETIPADPEISVILGVFQSPFAGNPFGGDIDYISGSLVPKGTGDGEVDITTLSRFAIDGDPSGVNVPTDLVGWFLETAPYALECFSIVSTDSTGDLNKHLCTVKNFHGTPRDIAVMPTHKGGYDFGNWVIVLEEGTGTWSIEAFDQYGEKKVGYLDMVGYPANMDVDPATDEVHIWFSVVPGGPLFAMVLNLTLG